MNHCARAQDLMVQNMAQWSIDLALVSEPYRVLPRADWFGDADGLVALVFGPRVTPPSLGSTTKGHGFVVANMGALTVVGVYFSPNRPLAEFEMFLGRLTLYVGGASGPVLVAGDFNAKSTLWGSPATNARGRVMAEWLASTGLVVVNTGSDSTCVRRQGESIVDLTLASPNFATRIVGWHVSKEETLSDHRYIRFDVSAHTSELGRTFPAGGGPRWSLRRLNKDLLEEAAIVASWSRLPSDDVEECAE
ncbi:uncharacterized protein LOC121729081 [Aricia agestis]|uniref:uncharacterized protein LOC121729081 n=1 Tax=Aricia agestis TaxID=91739 RepID=UPI001C20271C|nr:uncharacterized protein LOC121729081 [Aricia agestis]